MAAKARGRKSSLAIKPAQAREIDEAGVGRQAQHRQHAAHRHVVEPAPSRPPRRPVATARSGSRTGPDPSRRSDRRGQVGDSAQQHRQNRHDQRQRAVGVLDRRLLERADAVADGLDAGHGGAAAGERPQQQPQPDGSPWRRAGRRERQRDAGCPPLEMAWTTPRPSTMNMLAMNR